MKFIYYNYFLLDLIIAVYTIACNWHHGNIAQTIRKILLFFVSCLSFVCLLQFRLWVVIVRGKEVKKIGSNEYIIINILQWHGVRGTENLMKNCARLIRCKFFRICCIDRHRPSVWPWSINVKCILNLQWLSFVHFFAPTISDKHTIIFSFYFFPFFFVLLAAVNYIALTSDDEISLNFKWIFNSQ